MPKPPPYVSLIFFGSHVKISYSTKAVREAITAAGYEIFKDEYCVCNVKIETQVADKDREDRLNHLLLFLNDLEIVFGEDYKQAMAPADYMRDLQDRTVLRKPFRSIGWGAPEGFLIRTIEAKHSQPPDQAARPPQ